MQDVRSEATEGCAMAGELEVGHRLYGLWRLHNVTGILAPGVLPECARRLGPLSSQMSIFSEEYP